MIQLYVLLSNVALKRVRPFVSMHTAIKMYKGLIEPLTSIIAALYVMA